MEESNRPMTGWAYIYFNKKVTMDELQNGLCELLAISPKNLLLYTWVPKEFPSDALVMCDVLQGGGTFPVGIWVIPFSKLSTQFPEEVTLDIAIKICNLWNCNILTRIQNIGPLIMPEDSYQWHFVTASGLIQLIELNAERLDNYKELIIETWLEIVR